MTRRNKKSRLMLVGATAVVLAGAFEYATALAEETRGRAPSDSLEEIVVTAAKREERLIDTPLAISALSSATLENLNVQKFADYMGLVPNLSQVASAAPGFGTVVLRGLYTGAQQITATTAFYVGETPFTPSGALSLGAALTPDPDLLDIERVEVLKGPQGTLYGATALGGVIRIVPKAPNLTKMDGRARVGISSVQGGGTGYGARASINLPVVTDRFALRLSAFDRKDGGFTTNIKTSHSELGSTDAKGGSITALWRINDTLDVSARALLQNSSTDGYTMQQNVLGTGTPLFGERQYSTSIDQGVNTRYRVFELFGNYTAALGTLTATLAQGRSNLDTATDYTAAYGVLIARRAPVGFATPFTTQVGMDKKSAEIRFASKRLGAFEFLAGGFYTKESDFYNGQIRGLDSTGAALAPALNDIGTFYIPSDYKERAAYADVTYYLTDAIDFTAGARYAKNDQDAYLIGSGIIYAGTPRIKGYTISSSDSASTYQYSVRWRPARNLSTYVRAASGYRPGGPQTNPNPPAGAQPFYLPDKVWNYEAGIKGRTAGGHLNFDAAIYYTDWTDVQLNGLSNGVILVGNAGKATVRGAEAQLTGNVTEQFSLGASFGYNRARLAEVGTTTAAVLGAVNGDRLPGSPEVTGALFGDYRFPLAADWQGSVGATARYQGSQWTSYSRDKLNPPLVIPSYYTFDLRATARHDRYELRLGLENLSDENGYTSYTTVRITPVAVPSNAYLIRSRTYSLSLAVDF